MKMILIFVIALWPLTNVGYVTGYNVSCPSATQWDYVSSKCPSKQKYTCLFDVPTNIYIESCDGPRSEGKGERTVTNSGYFDTVPCSIERYQPFGFTTKGNSDCAYLKSSCEGEGLITFEHNSSKHDRTCRCDSTTGYEFTITPINIHYCIPSEEDCSCLCSFEDLQHCSSLQHVAKNPAFNENSTLNCKEFSTVSLPSYSRSSNVFSGFIVFVNIVVVFVIIVFVLVVLAAVVERDIDDTDEEVNPEKQRQESHNFFDIIDHICRMIEILSQHQNTASLIQKLEELKEGIYVQFEDGSMPDNVFFLFEKCLSIVGGL